MKAPHFQVTTHPSESPGQIRAAVLAGLKSGRLPGRLLYQSPRQAQRWLAYHQAYSPSRTDPKLRELYRQAFAAAVAQLGGGPLVAVSLGSGGGQKDGDLFAAVAPAFRAPSVYVPVDTSPALVLEAAAHVTGRHPGLATHPLVADLEAGPDARGWLDGFVPAHLPRLLCAFGLIPNLPPERLLAYLRGQMRLTDALLLSANLSPRGFAQDATRILSQYDNPPARSWYAGALEDLGVAAADVELRVEAMPTTTDGDSWRIEVSAETRREVSLTAFGEPIPWPAGKPLRLFFSHRFTAAAFRERLSAAGLVADDAWEGADGEEGIWLCHRRS